MATPAAARIVRRTDVFLLPFLSLLFLLNSLDRSNIGNAETAGFTEHAGLQPRDLNDAVAFFFVAFVALQPVGASLAKRFGVARWVGGVMAVWGCLTVLNAFVTTRAQLILLRTAIGCLEAGFYPATVFYLSLFYTRYEFAQRLGIFFGQSAVAGACGGLLSYIVFRAFPAPNPGTAGARHWHSYQLLFIFEGVLTVCVALVAIAWLPTGPGTAWWLSPAERAAAEVRVLRDRAADGEGAGETRYEHIDSDDEYEDEEQPRDSARLRKKSYTAMASVNDAGPYRNATPLVPIAPEEEEDRRGLLPVLNSAPISQTSLLPFPPEDEDDGCGLLSVPSSPPLSHGAVGPVFPRRTKHARAPGGGEAHLTRADVLSAVLDGKIWVLLVLNICSSVPGMAFSVFLPLVLRGMHYSPLASNLLTVPPFLLGAVTLWTITYASDRRRARLPFMLLGLGICTAGLAAAVYLPRTALAARYAALCVLLAGSYVASPLQVAWLAGNTPEPATRAVVLGINGWGNLAGVLAARLYAPRFAPAYERPLAVTLALVAASAAGYAAFWAWLRRENARRRAAVARWPTAGRDRERRAGRGPAPPCWRRRVWRACGVEWEGRRGDARWTFEYSL